MTIYYVYAYISKRTNLPYYIGKGKGKRAFHKHRVSVPKDRSRIVFLETNLTEVGSFALERRYIRWYGRRDIGTGILLNLTDGGDNPPKTFGPKPQSVKDKIAASKRGKPGVVHSEETKQKISQGLKGRKCSDDHKRKVSEASKEQWRLWRERRGITPSATPNR